MRTEDADKFYRLLTGAAELLDRSLTPVTFELYFAALADLSLEQIEEAMRGIMRGAKFFPKPVEIREAYCGTADDRAEAAWETVVRAIARFGAWKSLQVADPLLAAAIRETWGDWPRACETLPLPGEPMFASDHKRFLVAFRLAERKTSTGSGYFVGLAEIHNRQQTGAMLEGAQSGELLYFQPVGVIEAGGAMSEQRLAFSRETGRLTDESRRLLAGDTGVSLLPEGGARLKLLKGAV
jgi:hypothetical protein